jgi:hypothetical protein
VRRNTDGITAPVGNSSIYDFSVLRAQTPPLLIVLGHDDHASATATGGFRVGGSSDVYKLLPPGFPFDQVNLSRQFLKQRPKDVSHYQCILNLVTDPDQHPKTLAALKKLLRGFRGRVINPPEAVLQSTRDQVARRLAGTSGLRVPKVVRLRPGKREAAVQAISRAGLQFPLILRRAGTHTGKIVGVFHGPDDLAAALTAETDHIATEFVNLEGGDGLYRKYRVYFFGTRVVYRNQYVSDQWNVHSKDHIRCLAERPQLQKELLAMFGRPEGAFPGPVFKMFREVRTRMPLDYFGLDFGFMPDGEAVLFEANATMSFFPSWTDVQFRHCLPPACQAFRELVDSAISRAA